MYSEAKPQGLHLRIQKLFCLHERNHSTNVAKIIFPSNCGNTVLLKSIYKSNCSLPSAQSEESTSSFIGGKKEKEHRTAFLHIQTKLRSGTQNVKNFR